MLCLRYFAPMLIFMSVCDRAEETMIGVLQLSTYFCKNVLYVKIYFLTCPSYFKWIRCGQGGFHR